MAYGYGLSGAGVKVGIVDSGFNLVSGQPVHGEFSTAGKITVLNSTAPLASDAHGAHVSALAVGDRNGTVMQGVAYNASLYLGTSPGSPTGFKALFDEYTQRGVTISSNSYGVPIKGDETSPWKAVKTSTDGYEVTAKNALAYRNANGLTSEQMMTNIITNGETPADWSATISSIKSYQNAGGVVVWANSNYGTSNIANGMKGLDDVDLVAALPLAFTDIMGGWITVSNATSKGLATQYTSADYVSKAVQENNIVLISAPCGLAANFCLSMDGVELWSASNKGVGSYENQTGTSQATPEVAGMLALLREAFPTASAADLAARLLFTADNSFFTTGTTASTITTASYTNANGTVTHLVSNIWGHGFADLQAALNPVGATTTRSLAGTLLPTSAIQGNLQLGGAFGRGESAIADARYLFNDVLNGVFVGNVGLRVATTADSSTASVLADRVLDQAVATAQTGSGLSLSFARAVVPDDSGSRARIGGIFSIAQRFGKHASLAYGSGFSPDTTLGFAPRHATLRSASVSDRAMGIPLLALGGRRQSWFATGWSGAHVKTTLAYFGSARTDQRVGTSLYGNARTQGMVADIVYTGLGLASVDVSVGQVREDNAFLGSQSVQTSLTGSANSRFARVGVQVPLGRGFGVQGNYVVGLSRIATHVDSLLSYPSQIRSEAMALQVYADNVVKQGSRLTLGIASPLRVAAGRASLNLPQSVTITAPGDYSYGFENAGVRLAPSGRELDYTVEYSQKLFAGASASFTGMAIHNPGHDADAAMGVAGVAGLKFGF